MAAWIKYWLEKVEHKETTFFYLTDKSLVEGHWVQALALETWLWGSMPAFSY